MPVSVVKSNAVASWGRYALIRESGMLSYEQLCSELPIQSWPLPGVASYAVQQNAVDAARTLNLRVPAEGAVA